MNTSFIRLSILIGILILLTRCNLVNDPGGDWDTDPPTTPDSLAVESKDGAVDLSWAANSEPDLVGYNLYRSDSSFSEVSDMEPVNGTSPVTSPFYTDDSLQNGTTYHYRLTAIDDNFNESEVSAPKKVTPFSGPPDRP